MEKYEFLRSPKQLLDKYYSDSPLSRQMVEKWFTDFKRGRTNTDDADCSGPLNSTVISENLKKSSVRNGYRVCSQSIKNYNASTIQIAA